ncbi:MAG: hypothetical protein P4L85_27065 [Paludisphaera borealis]|uniref:DUF4175 family protein n=1 Tax=Paludisphaera borealis TaxID=1387353 RepID=UPI00284AE184|nr:DUF4175 family protein [Paludisphaera borealis]MDR3623043.1 hypothetical protein [Paludisphaera borealis]
MNVELKTALMRVASRIRRARLWSGLAACWLVWAILAATLAALGPHPVGLAVELAALAILSGLACVVFAIRSARDPLDVARRIESTHPDLKAGLLTAVEGELSRSPAERRGFLQQTVIDKAIDHGRTHDWVNAVVPRKRLAGARVAHAAALCALVAAFTALVVRSRSEKSPDAPAVARIAPAEVQVLPGDAEIERGTSLLVVARFNGAVPPEAKLVVDDAPAQSAPRAMTRSLDDPTFAGRVESVDADLSYHVEFGAERTPSYRIRVFENPELTRTDAKLVYPSYTSLEPKLAEDVRHVTAVEGTELTLLFRLNKEVASATLVDEQGVETALATTDEAASAPAYRASFRLADTHRYKVQLIDREGRRNKLTAEIAVNVTRNRPPAIVMNLPGHDVRVSPVEELRLKAQVDDDFGVIRQGVNFSLAGQEPQDVVTANADPKQVKKTSLEHMIAFESLKAVPDQLVTYFVWAEDVGPDGATRRTDGDMYFAEVRHFEEIFRQGEQPSSASQEQEQQGGGNAQQADQLAELQKQIVNGTWKVVRREIGAKPTDKLVDDARTLEDSQKSAVEQATALGEKLQDAASKASLAKAVGSMNEAARLLGEAAAANAPTTLKPALAAEQAAYQALLKLRAREFEVVRNNARQRQRGGQAGGSPSQRQLNQLELTNDENRFEEQSRAKEEQLSQKEQEQRETRQVVSRLRELAQRQADLNDRLKELQSALEAAKDEPAKKEIERQLKRLREQQQQILRDSDELQERMENEQNRERMADSRQQVEQGREHVRQTSEALEEGRLS